MAVLSAKLTLSRSSVNDQQLFDLAYDLAKRLLSKKMSKDKIRKVMNFLRYYLHFDNPEMFVKFEREIAVLTQKSITMGIEEFLLDRAEKQGIEKGIEKGREEKQVIFVNNLIAQLGLSDEQIASLAEVSVDFVKIIRNGLKK